MEVPRSTTYPPACPHQCLLLLSLLALVSPGETPLQAVMAANGQGELGGMGQNFPGHQEAAGKKKKNKKVFYAPFTTRPHGNCPELLSPSSPIILAAPPVLSGTSKSSIS